MHFPLSFLSLIVCMKLKLKLLVSCTWAIILSFIEEKAGL